MNIINSFKFETKFHFFEIIFQFLEKKFHSNQTKNIGDLNYLFIFFSNFQKLNKNHFLETFQ